MRILTVYAHPDDESFGPAAVLAKYARGGADLRGLWFTRGEHGQPTADPPPSPADLARDREQDLRDVARLIGYRSVEILDYEDGTLETLPPGELERHVLECLTSVAPDVVLTFGPGGITHHPDHMAVHRATVAAFHKAREHGLPLGELYYDAVRGEAAERLKLTDEPDGQPNTFIDVHDSQQVKRDALAIHARHVADAVARLERLQREPLAVETLYRAWPPLEPGALINGFLQ